MFCSSWASTRNRFLSTPSARRATRLAPERYAGSCRISIHALREEGDRLMPSLGFPYFEFLSTPSARRATCRRETGHPAQQISIHALREEGDALLLYSSNSLVRFLSTPSARRATHIPQTVNKSRKFLSTPSARRATCNRAFRRARPQNFYPRPPRGGRPQQGAGRTWAVYFYPRPPRGGRPCAGCSGCRFPAVYFYPRPPRGGRLPSGKLFYCTDIFLSTPSARRATPPAAAPVSSMSDFYPRPPRGGRRTIPVFSPGV